MTWDELYNLFGVKDFIYFISSSQIQDYLFPVRLIFVCFAMVFLFGLIYFMLNSSWLQYKFLEDVTEFFSWQAYGLREVMKQWNKIKKRIDTGAEPDFKLAIIEADDFFIDVLEKAGYDAENFQDSIKKAGRLLNSSASQILTAHETRNSIVFNPDFKISLEETKKILDIYESGINSIGMG
jgi:hypothetical protein